MDDISLIFYLHSREKYFPVSIKYILDNSILIDHNINYKKNKPSEKDLYKISEKYNFKKRNDGDIIIFLKKIEKIEKMEKILNNVPIYLYKQNIKEKTYFTYIIFFSYNGDYNILNIFNIGSHYFDIEYITIELINKNINRVYFSFHNNGIWINKDKLIYKNNKLEIFISLNGHGMYPYEGINIRYFGLVNDYMDKGKLWIPKVENISNEFLLYNGRFGGSLKCINKSGINGLLNRSWINENNYNFYNYYYVSYEEYNNILFIKNLFLFYFIVYLLLFFIFKKFIKRFFKNKK